MGKDPDIIGMMTGLTELGYVFVLGLFLLFVVIPIMDHFSKKFRGYKN